MKRRNLYIAVFVIAVLGLFIVQIQFLRIGLNLAKVQFDKKVSESVITIQEDLAQRNQLTFLIEQALLKESTFFTISPDSITDASRHFLNDFIKYRLTENGIDAPYSFRLFTRDSSYYLTAPQVFEAGENSVNYPFTVDGYLAESLDKQILLELQFNDLNNYFFFQLNGLTIPSLLFIITIIVVVIWVLRSFYWQRNIITTTNEFINNFTHELKTPVFSIGLASKMLNEKVAEKDKPLVNTIREQLTRLDTHIDKVLELGSLESKKKYLTATKLDFKPNLERICELFNATAQLQGFEFNYKLSGPAYPIKAVPAHLEIAINNVLDNARKYGENKPINLAGKTMDKQLVITIKDQGLGVSKKEQQNIFKKYYRVPQGDVHKYQGYGLGLTYVAQVLKRLRGSITFNSESGNGSTIIIKIPLVHGA